MAVAKKAAADVAAQKTIDDFKTSIVELGIKLCDDVKAGMTRNPEETMRNIAELYTSIK